MKTNVSFTLPKQQTVRPNNPPATFETHPASLESSHSTIAPIPNTWRPDLNSNSIIQFEPDNTAAIDEPSDSSLGYDLNLRQPGESSNSSDAIADLELRKLREDLQKLPEHMGIIEFEDMPVQGYGSAILEGYGWRKGRGIGRNVVEDVKVMEVKTNNGRAGLGFIGGLEENRAVCNGNAYQNGDVRFTGVGRVAEAEKLPKKLGELEVRAKNIDQGIRDSSERVSWLRNHIRVRIVTKELKGGRLFSKTGVVFDVVGPGTCDLSIDETGELVQGVNQEMLEIVIPKCGDLVLVFKGRFTGVFGRLLELNLDSGMGTICNVDSHESLVLMVDQIAEFTGDLSDTCY